MEALDVAMEKYVFDERISKGPKKNRSCTDVITCGTSFGFFAFWIFVIVYAYTEGDLKHVSIPEDTVGRFCGKKSGEVNYTNFPYLYLDPTTISTNPTMAINERLCVQKCPNIGELPSYPLTNTASDGIYGANARIATGETQLMYGKYCQPKDPKIRRNIDPWFSKLYLFDFTTVIVENWWIILASFGLVFILSFLFTIVLVNLNSILMIIVGILNITGYAFIGVYHMIMYIDFMDLYSNFKNYTIKEVNYYYTMGVINLILAIFWFIWTASAVIQVTCYFKKLILTTKFTQVAATIFRNADNFFAIPSTLLIVFAIATGLWISTFCFVNGMGLMTYHPDLPYRSVVFTAEEYFLQIYLFLAGIWIPFFLADYGHLTISYLTSKAYFNDRDLCQQEIKVFDAMVKIFSNHLGTVSLGSLLQMITNLFRAPVQMFALRISKTNEKSCISCFDKTLCGCFKRMILFINQLAYTEIAQNSVSFCQGAYDSMNLFQSHTKDIWFFKYSLEVIQNIFAGTVASITTLVAFIVFLCYNNQPVMNNCEIMVKSLPLFYFIFYFSYKGCDLFISLFNHSALVTLHCCYIDIGYFEKTLGGSPKYMPEEIKDFLAEMNSDKAGINKDLVETEEQNKQSA